MPVKTVTSPCSEPQVTFRQATRGVSNENGLRQARHMARVDLVCLVQFAFSSTSRRKMIALPQLFSRVYNRLQEIRPPVSQLSFCPSMQHDCHPNQYFQVVFKKYRSFLYIYVYIQRDQFASETPHAAKMVHAVSKTFLLLLRYALTLTALLLQSQENFLVFSKQTVCSF